MTTAEIKNKLKLAKEELAKLIAHPKSNSIPTQNFRYYERLIKKYEKMLASTKDSVKKYKVGKYIVTADSPLEAAKVVKLIDSQIKDAGWFNLTIIDLQDSSELTLTRLVTDVKKVVGSTVAEITNGRFSNGTLHLQVLVKDRTSNKFTWMELPILYQLSPATLRKLYAEFGNSANSLKAQSEINAKLKQFAGKQLYKDKSIVSDSFILIDDEASQLQTVNALIEDEKAAVEAYNVAIENLHGKIPEESLQVLITTRDDENRHIENLQAVVNGTVTEKNLEDSMKIKDSRWYVEVVRRDTLNGRVRSGSFIVEATTEKEANEKAKAQAKRQWGDNRDFSFYVSGMQTKQLDASQK